MQTNHNILTSIKVKAGIHMPKSTVTILVERGLWMYSSNALFESDHQRSLFL